MRTTANVAAVAAAVVALSGCSYTVDTGPLEAQIAAAKDGDFGTCYTKINEAAEALGEAEKGLAFIKSINGSYAQPYYDKAVAQVTQAMAARQAADAACHTRVAALEAKMPEIMAALDSHDKRISALENANLLMRGVTFLLGSSKLTPPAKSALDIVGNMLLREPTDVEIAGHASTPGGPEMNMALSTARAETVRKYLMGLGVDGSRMTAKGYGETQPLADDSTREGRRANQRVELLF